MIFAVSAFLSISFSIHDSHGTNINIFIIIFFATVFPTIYLLQSLLAGFNDLGVLLLFFSA